MLVIRMQRTGRAGHAQFRVVVQDSRRTPTSGKIVAALGSFNPNTQEPTANKAKAALYLCHGAQPSERFTRLLNSEGVHLPDWAALAEAEWLETRHAEKLRKNQPAKEVIAEEAPVEESVAEEAPEAEEPASEEVATEAVPEAEKPAEAPTEEPAA